MVCKLTKFWVKNFKSLKDVEIGLRNFNLLVGKNASGKTNFIEAIKLMKMILTKDTREYNPFFEWGGYNNVVWMRNEALPIILGFEAIVGDHVVTYEICVSGTWGIFKILSEMISIHGLVNIERKGVEVFVEHDKKFFESALGEIEKEGISLVAPLREIREKCYKIEKFPHDVSLLRYPGWSAEYICENRYAIVTTWYPKLDLLSPCIKQNGAVSPIICTILSSISKLWNSAVILRTINFEKIREPQRPKKELTLEENGSNLTNVMLTLFSKKEESVEKIRRILSIILNNEIKIKTDITDDGRSYIKIFEHNLELQPSMSPEGVWKILAILVAIESEPSLIAIDELENSLHPEAIEYIVRELKECKATVIVTTHSPAVVDIIEPEDLILVEKDREKGSHLRRVVDAKKIKKLLKKYGITLSEGWLYGEIF